MRKKRDKALSMNFWIKYVCLLHFTVLRDLGLCLVSFCFL